MSAEELPGIDPRQVFRLGGTLVAYRIAKTDRRFDPALLDSFKSNYELGRKPRRVEVEFTPVHMGISVYLAQAIARDTAKACPKIGAYVAELHLEPSSGAAFALTAQPGHLTVWGRALELVGSVVDIVPVGG